jgi:CheY-like chemotaxis protein
MVVSKAEQLQESIMKALRKVLVVDDDPVVGKSFNRVLSSKGYVVTTAENALEALEQMRRDEYDLVVTDIRMPGMSGLELAETVKARRPWTPVLIVTGFGDDDAEKRAKAAGVSAFLHKPLSPEMIEDSAAEALRSALPANAPTVASVPIEAAAAEAAAETVTTLGGRIKDVALFLAAPFIGLLYAVFMPFVGIGMAAWFGLKALGKYAAMRRAGEVALDVAKFVAAPFIGLAYAVFMPFVGIAMLAWFAGKAVVAKLRPE